MIKTIELTRKSTKWFEVISGMIFIAIVIRKYSESNSMTTWGIIDVILVLAGLLMIIYGVILFNPTNKLTPKIQIDEMGILIKESIYKRPTKIEWKNMKAIMFTSFRLNFLLNDNTTKGLNLWQWLWMDQGAFVEIKKTIREFANDRQIKIIEK